MKKPDVRFIARNFNTTHVFATGFVADEMKAVIAAELPKLPKSYKKDVFVTLDANPSTQQQIGRMLANVGHWQLEGNRQIIRNDKGQVILRTYFLKSETQMMAVRFHTNPSNGFIACNLASIHNGKFSQNGFCKAIYETINKPGQPPKFAPSWYHLLVMHLAGVKINYNWEIQSMDQVLRGYRKGLWERQFGGFYPIEISDLRLRDRSIECRYHSKGIENWKQLPIIDGRLRDSLMKALEAREIAQLPGTPEQISEALAEFELELQ